MLPEDADKITGMRIAHHPGHIGYRVLSGQQKLLCRLHPFLGDVVVHGAAKAPAEALRELFLADGRLLRHGSQRQGMGEILIDKFPGGKQRLIILFRDGHPKPVGGGTADHLLAEYGDQLQDLSFHIQLPYLPAEGAVEDFRQDFADAWRIQIGFSGQGRAGVCAAEGVSEADGGKDLMEGGPVQRDTYGSAADAAPEKAVAGLDHSTAHLALLGAQQEMMFFSAPKIAPFKAAVDAE